MRPAVYAPFALFTVTAAFLTTGCDGCSGKSGPSEAERTQILASAIAATPPPAAAPKNGDSIGHPANVIPGEGPKRVESNAPRMGPAFPILPGQGIGPIRFGATRQTIERLMAAPCDDATETLCRYVARGVDFKLEGGATTEIRISRKGREAKRGADGSIIEYGFFNGAIMPDLYFGMQPGALQEHLGAPQKVEKIAPLGKDALSERHFYDGMTLEYDLWSNGKLVLGAAILTKSETAAAANDKAEAERAKVAAERAKQAAKTRPTRVPR
jgi:hypothetical protein